MLFGTSTAKHQLLLCLWKGIPSSFAKEFITVWLEEGDISICLISITTLPTFRNYVEELKKTTWSEHSSNQRQSICMFAVSMSNHSPPWVFCWFLFRCAVPEFPADLKRCWTSDLSVFLPWFAYTEPHCIPPGDKNCSHCLEIYHLQTSHYGMHFQSFSDWFWSAILANSAGFTEPEHPSKQLQWPPPATRH